MVSSHGNTHMEAARMEQIITEFFAKSLHIILESRTPFASSRNFSGEQTVSSPSSSSSSSSSVRPRDKWFNLALRECPAALENLDLWRQSDLEHLIVDVILVQKPLDWDPVNYSPKRELMRNLSGKERYPYCWTSHQDEMGCEAKTEIVIERWVVQYESRKVRDSGFGRRTSNTLQNCYKKLVLLLRSLYVTLRLLPGYKVLQDLNSSGQIRAFSLTHRVSSFVEPFSRKQESEMHQFGFAPVDTSCGRLCLSVIYLTPVSDLSSEPSTTMSPQFIPDYVGSPLADPLKRFPSLPVSHGSPSSLPCSRRHSWSFDRHKASPPLYYFSPSPTHSEPRAVVSNPSSRRYAHVNLPPHPLEAFPGQKRDAIFDEYYPSPNFTPSQSPSPPIHIPDSDLSKLLLRSESAPVGIPISKLYGYPGLSHRQTLPPCSPPTKVSRYGTITDRNMGQAVPVTEKFHSLDKGDTKKGSGLKVSSSSTPQVSFSTCCSRSFHDDFDGSEFPCPFDLDDISNPGSRPESFDQKGHLFERLESGGMYPAKSQDAAVGALVNMFQKAPPLQQDSSSSWSSYHPGQSRKQDPIGIQQASVSSVGPVKSKTTADAFEELRGYRDMVRGLNGQDPSADISS